MKLLSSKLSNGQATDSQHTRLQKLEKPLSTEYIGMYIQSSKIR